MNEHKLVPKTINLCVAYKDGAAGDPAVRRIGKGRDHMSMDGTVRRPG